MKKVLIYTFILVIGLISCRNNNEQEVILLETIELNNLNNNDIYLVKVNKSNTIVRAANTGGARSSGFYNNTNILPDYEDDCPLIGYPPALQFNAAPPPIGEPIRSSLAAFTPPVVGDTRNFWVENFHGRGMWEERQATLRATGLYGNIWVMDENYSVTNENKPNNQITAEQAEALSDKFDLIYTATTNIFGYEFGGGPGGDGGKDGDPKIQILVYDIVDIPGNAVWGGYFWGKDFYEQSQLDSWNWNLKTNLAEIFYIDTSVINSNLNYTYSLLIHELQHMINFNMKFVKHNINSAAWYNEMLSAMAEDIIAPLIGVDTSSSGHIVRRIRRFLIWYDQVGITEWDGSSNSYAKSFAFGAYLLRNYGGAELVKKIIDNNTTNIESISSALNEITPGMNFEKALERFGEVMIYGGSQIPEGFLTFSNTVSNTINSYTYTAYSFDIWNDFDIKGPVIFDLTAMDMRPHSISIHSVMENISGDISITLEKPTNSNVVLQLLVK